MDAAGRRRSHGSHGKNRSHGKPGAAFPKPPTSDLLPTDFRKNGQRGQHGQRGRSSGKGAGRGDSRAWTLRAGVGPIGPIRPIGIPGAAFPSTATRNFKYWPTVSRVDNVYGDRNLVCTCTGMDAYATT